MLHNKLSSGYQICVYDLNLTEQYGSADLDGSACRDVKMLDVPQQHRPYGHCHLTNSKSLWDN